jgi:hypothetical protein
VIVVVLEIHLIHAVIDIGKVLVVVQLVGVSLVTSVNILLVLLHSAVRRSNLLLADFNATAIDLLKEPQEVAIVDNIVKGSCEKVDEAQQLARLNLLLAAVKNNIHKVSLLYHTGLISTCLLEFGLEVQLKLLV